MAHVTVTESPPIITTDGLSLLTGYWAQHDGQGSGSTPATSTSRWPTGRVYGYARSASRNDARHGNAEFRGACSLCTCLLEVYVGTTLGAAPCQCHHRVSSRGTNGKIVMDFDPVKHVTIPLGQHFTRESHDPRAALLITHIGRHLTVKEA